MSSYKQVTRKAKASTLVGDAFSELQGLAEEMREWADNMEEKFGSTQKYQDVSDAADNLENISDEPTWPEGLDDPEIEVTETIKKGKRGGPSRSVRRDNAVSGLTMVKDYLEELQGDQESYGKNPDVTREGIEALINELSDIIDYAEAAEFPGMFG